MKNNGSGILGILDNQEPFEIGKLTKDSFIQWTKTLFYNSKGTEKRIFGYLGYEFIVSAFEKDPELLKEIAAKGVLVSQESFDYLKEKGLIK